MKAILIFSVLVLSAAAHASTFACQVLLLKNVTRGDQAHEQMSGSSETVFIENDHLRGYGPGFQLFPIISSDGDLGLVALTAAPLVVGGKPWISLEVNPLLEMRTMSIQNLAFPSDSSGGQVTAIGQSSFSDSTTYITETVRCLKAD